MRMLSCLIAECLKQLFFIPQGMIQIKNWNLLNVVFLFAVVHDGRGAAACLMMVMMLMMRMMVMRGL